ncbi:ABC transporter ATP-binding protein [Paracoccus gahaiensis]|uniref:ABC transporter ATP-binding protein n=1 Tax=Paracoccus gahaiensis TaxID=1706839 RepID=A0A4U0R4L3_9RHOB|nr:ABC transporter ATP-binding protein [Paracoccus gahaiensis]TJZ89871.1 ABC transporter ATP-binding protein [Paracoccus gahaiensis]
MARSRPDTLTDALPGLRRVLRRFAPYLRPHRAVLTGATAALIGATLMRLLEPWPLKFVIDRVVPASLAGTGGSGVTALDTMTLLTLCALGLVAIIGLRALFQYLSTIGYAVVGSRVLTEVRSDLFRHLQGLSLGFHTRSKTGDLTMRLIGDVGMLKETAVTAALPLAANVLVLLGMIVVMLVLDWQLALIALLPLPVLWLCSIRAGKKIQTVSRKQRKVEGDMAATAAEAMASMRTVQALSIEDRAAESFVSANGKSLADGVKAKRIAAGLERLVDLLVACAIALVLYFGTLQVLRGRLTPGDLLVFITYLKATFRPIRSYAKYSSRLAKASAAGERVVQLLDEEPEIRDRPGAMPAPAYAGRIAFEGVTFGYGADKPTLEGFSLDIAPGTNVALTGPSGAGKSTLAGLLLRLYDPSGGRIAIDGQNIRDVTLTSLRRQIGLVPQETVLFRGSLAENIALGAGREVSPEQIEAAARLANAHDFIAALPDGYGAQVAERGASLSAGQRQRIAIARAALRDCPILIFDEPTTGLDSSNESTVTEAIWRLARGRTSLLITHDLSQAARADRILFLEAGRIAEEGTHADLLARGGRYARLWALQGRGQGGGALRAVAG